jgi:hypothetical protein
VRLSTYLIAIPVVVIAAILAVANRGVIVVSLDPFSREAPALALQMPLFLALFIAFGLGILVGGLAAAISWRKKG